MENLFLVTVDVKALCKNIPNNEGIPAVRGKQDNYIKKTVATKLITTFLALILTLKTLILTQNFTSKSNVVLWEQYAPLTPKRDTSIFSLKTCPAAICALFAIFLWYGPTQRTNLNRS